MLYLFRAAQQFLRKEEGPTAVEYAVMLALIVAICLGAVSTLGTNANGVFSAVATATSGSSGPSYNNGPLVAGQTYDVYFDPSTGNSYGYLPGQTARSGLSYEGTGTYTTTPPAWDSAAGPGVSMNGGSSYVPGVKTAP